MKHFILSCALSMAAIATSSAQQTGKLPVYLDNTNRVGGKRSSFSPTFRFPTSHTTVRAVPHTAVPILGATRCMNPSM